MERGSTEWILDRTKKNADAAAIETAQLVVPLYRIVRKLAERTAVLLAPLGLNQPEFEVLQSLFLCEKGERLSLKELNRALLFSSGGITKIIDRLAAAGFVQTEADPDDRRRRLCSLTPAGRSITRRALKKVVTAETEIVNAAEPSARVRLSKALIEMAKTVEARNV